MFQDAGWAGPASDGKPYSPDLRDRVVGSVAGGAPVGRRRRCLGELRQCREVVAAPAHERQRGCQADGRVAAADGGGKHCQEAQRFPNDFEGIIVWLPVNDQLGEFGASPIMPT